MQETYPMGAGVMDGSHAKAGASGSTRGGEVGKYLGTKKPITKGTTQKPKGSGKSKGY